MYRNEEHGFKNPLELALPIGSSNSRLQPWPAARITQHGYGLDIEHWHSSHGGTHGPICLPGLIVVTYSCLFKPSV